ncbi:methylglyoxal synthase [Ignatzschineria ureiclastica]|uniref:Methylglyoxal synthase n=2 Tax=Ignatzschineria TaxID=112008 RepID=A0A2U2ACB8_9GAMM|nr:MULTISPECIES: methylglyoxal synthase [Ignatzschineria]PWD80293.1 methylglyoxal synthase [Ignatzschineria ureiclastica]GHA02755.1 methylglyoxal synthase [Ignatzschineria ureiclastica]
MKRLSIGLVAHDAKKKLLVDWIGDYLPYFRQHDLYATGTTGKHILDAYPDLSLTRLKSGPLGGDQQLGSMICTEKLDLLIFFTDALTPMPHDVDVKALIRLSTLYNIPNACNTATASLLMQAIILNHDNNNQGFLSQKAP